MTDACPTAMSLLCNVIQEMLSFLPRLQEVINCHCGQTTNKLNNVCLLHNHKQDTCMQIFQPSTADCGDSSWVELRRCGGGCCESGDGRIGERWILLLRLAVIIRSSSSLLLINSSTFFAVPAGRKKGRERSTG
jgi:hypothetical protein